MHHINVSLYLAAVYFLWNRFDCSAFWTAESNPPPSRHRKWRHRLSSICDVYRCDGDLIWVQLQFSVSTLDSACLMWKVWSQNHVLSLLCCPAKLAHTQLQFRHPTVSSKSGFSRFYMTPLKNAKGTNF